MLKFVICIEHIMKLCKSYLHTGRKTFHECANQGTCDYQGGCSDEENWDLYLRRWHGSTYGKKLISLAGRLYRC